MDLVLQEELVPIDVDLHCLFLDPNNPRFAEFEHVYVPDEAIEAAQERIQELLAQQFQIDKLQMNIEVNGFLPIDRVVIRQISDGKYVVLEGNRRIAAAKAVDNASRLGMTIQSEVLESIHCIPCLQYTGTDTNAAWIFQGLRHITGIHEWPAFNKAKLLVDQMEDLELGLTEVGKRFGLTPHGAGQWVRGYKAFKQARESSDYITEVKEESYPYFQELFSNSSIAVREWMNWDDNTKQFRNELNFNEFIGWLYPRNSEIEESRGDWERRRIARRDDIRLIASLIRSDTNAFVEFRTGTDLEKAYSLSQARKFEEETRRTSDPTAKAFEAIEACIKACQTIPWTAMTNGETRAKFFTLLDDLQATIRQFRPNDGEREAERN